MWPPVQFTDACAVRETPTLLFDSHDEQRKRPVGANERGPQRFCQGAGLVSLHSQVQLLQAGPRETGCGPSVGKNNRDPCVNRVFCFFFFSNLLQ